MRQARKHSCRTSTAPQLQTYPVTLFWLSISTFGVCLASGFVPLINAELYLLAASAATPRHASLYLILMGTLGQIRQSGDVLCGPRHDPLSQSPVQPNDQPRCGTSSAGGADVT